MVGNERQIGMIKSTIVLYVHVVLGVICSHVVEKKYCLSKMTSSEVGVSRVSDADQRPTDHLTLLN